MSPPCSLRARPLIALASPRIEIDAALDARQIAWKIHGQHEFAPLVGLYETNANLLAELARCELLRPIPAPKPDTRLRQESVYVGGVFHRDEWSAFATWVGRNTACYYPQLRPTLWWRDVDHAAD